MARVQHPTIAHVFNDVPDVGLDAWLEAGWLECPAEINGQEPPAKASRKPPAKASRKPPAKASRKTPKTPETPGE